MVFKQTRAVATDRSGASRVRVIHTYHAWMSEYSLAGTYVKAAVESLSRMPPRIRGRRYRPMRPGFVVRALILMVAKPRHLANGVLSSSVWGSAAHLWLVRKSSVLRSKYHFGICQRPRFSLRLASSTSAVL
jgi:hypothetical protein